MFVLDWFLDPVFSLIFGFLNNNLKSLLRSVDNVVRLFYFSVSSSLFGSITKNLKEAQLITSQSRVVLEKPLGHNGESSKKINNEIAN